MNKVSIIPQAASKNDYKGHKGKCIVLFLANVVLALLGMAIVLMIIALGLLMAWISI